MKNPSESLGEPSTAQETPLARKARNRSKIVNLASRGRLPADVAGKVNVDDDVLLDDVTRAARDSVNATTTLSQAVAAAVDAGIDRDEIVDAIVAGGYALQTARNVVSTVSRAKGKSVRKSSGPKELPIAAVSFGRYMVEKCGGDAYHALKLAKKACKAIEAEIATLERAKAKSKPTAPVVVASVQVAA